VKATMQGLMDLRDPKQVAELRGLTIAEVLGLDPKEPEAAADAPADTPEPEAETVEA
jgi:small subunit ribosomal protein S5